MAALSIVQFEPILVWQQVSIQVISHVWVAILAYLSVLTECFPVLIAEFSLQQRIVTLESLLSCLSAQDAAVEVNADDA